jgi:hypothetical protein
MVEVAQLLTGLHGNSGVVGIVWGERGASVGRVWGGYESWSEPGKSPDSPSGPGQASPIKTFSRDYPTHPTRPRGLPSDRSPPPLLPEAPMRASDPMNALILERDAYARTCILVNIPWRPIVKALFIP